ncbi:MAG: hypothetical protein IT556_03960 [Acetobacteraceae bacterium]|nr:hypothetical protein [Acetobacteraceae bacterium]
MRARRGLLAVALVALLAGCQTDSRQQALATGQGQVALRQMQSRAFDTTDQMFVQRAVIATLQDLGFVVDQADSAVGTVSGTKLDGFALRMTVVTRPRPPRQTMVRANATFNVRAVESPQPYQQFFAALSRSLFLSEQQVD